MRIEKRYPGIRFIECPYGQPADLLWVRETFCVSIGTEGDRDAICHRADDSVYGAGEGESLEERWEIKATDLRDVANNKWIPSIHMPRWASRLTLELTDVRVVVPATE